jgi:hypothetical protein
MESGGMDETQQLADTEYTLSYASRRTDVWRWYWRTWRQRLWPVHVAIAGLLAWLAARTSGQPVLSVRTIEFTIAIFAGAVGISAIVSQLMFKKATRTLLVNKQGWSTVIGRKTGSRRWAEIGPVTEDADHVVLTSKSGNALLIPKNAFDSADHVRRFVDSVREWQRQASSV